MAQQIKLTVYNIDGASQNIPFEMSFLTNGIVPHEATLTNQPEVRSAIQYYDVADSPTKFTTFYVSELITDIIANCNTNITMQVPCTVISINDNILSVAGVKYSFPVNDISIWPSNAGTGINAFVKYKGDKYYVIETVSQLVTASNIGGGGGSGTVTNVSVVTKNGVSGSVANPTTTPDITLDLSVFAENGTPHEIWVDYSSDKSTLPNTKGSVANGSQAFPFTTIEDAISYADALAIAQPLTGLIINFEALPPLAVVADISIPSNLYLTIRGGSFETIGLNKITMSPTVGALCYLKLINLSVQEIEFIDDISGAGDIELIGESTNIELINQEPASVSTILVSLSSFYSDNLNTRGILNTMTAVQNCTLDIVGIRCVGAINLGVNGKFSASNSDVQTSVTSDQIKFLNCSIPNIVNSYGNFIEMQKSAFQAGIPLITFLAAVGTAYFDSETAISFGLNNGDIINGEALTQGSGPQLYRANESLNPLDSVIFTSGIPFKVSPSVLSNDTDVIGIVYPSVAGGKICLIWQSGESIPNVGLPTGAYYRYPLTGGYSSVPSTLQIGNGDGQNFFVNLQKTSSQQIMLSMLNPAGVWFPSEFVGPTAGSSSGPLVGIGNGVGFARIPKSGTLTNFKLTQTSTSATTIVDLQIYVSPNGFPPLLFYSGISLGVSAGDWISTDNISTLAVNEDDLVVIFNNESFGWTPGAMTITADLLIK